MKGNLGRRTFIKNSSGVTVAALIGLKSEVTRADESDTGDIEYEDNTFAGPTYEGQFKGADNHYYGKIKTTSFDVEVKNTGSAAASGTIKVELIDPGAVGGSVVRKTLTKSTGSVAAGATKTISMISSYVQVSCRHQGGPTGSVHCNYKIYIDGVLVDEGEFYGTIPPPP